MVRVAGEPAQRAAKGVQSIGPVMGYRRSNHLAAGPIHDQVPPVWQNHVEPGLHDLVVPMPETGQVH